MATTGKRNVEQDTQEEGMMMELGLFFKVKSQSASAKIQPNCILTEVRTTGGCSQMLDKVAFATFGQERGKSEQKQPL